MENLVCAYNSNTHTQRGRHHHHTYRNYWIILSFHSTYAKQLSWHAFPQKHHAPMSWGMQTFHSNRQMGGVEVCVLWEGGVVDVVTAWQRVNGGPGRWGERKWVDEGLTLEDEKDEEKWGEEGRGAETEGMCFPSGPSGAAFHCRYPEGDPHCVSGCLAHHEVIMGQPFPNYWQNTVTHCQVCDRVRPLVRGIYDGLTTKLIH